MFHDDFNVLGTFSKFRNVPKRSHTSGFMMILKSLVHSGSLSRVRRKTTFAHYEWNENSTLQKVAGTTNYSWFTINLMSLLHSASFSLLRRRAKFLHYRSLDSSIFQKLLGATEIASFMKISIPPGHSASVRLLQHKTSFVPHEWHVNLTPHKVPEATHTSCFTMCFMSEH